MARKTGRRQQPAAGIEARPRGAPPWPFAAAVLVAAWLLFTVQPLLGKAILPWFGGVPAVWITCLVFFQSALCAGYGLALGLGRLSGRVQAAAFVLLALLAAATLPVLPGASWRPAGGAAPVASILLLLSTCAGLPYLALACASPLLQSWYARRAPGRSPYPLFAVSGIGSLLGLLGYPLVLEHLYSLGRQDLIWAAGFALFALLAVVCAVIVRRGEGRAGAKPVEPEEEEEQRDATGAPREPAGAFWWLAWPFCGVVLLMAVTELLTQNVAAVPLLWVLPLAVYLLSYTAAFAPWRWYRRRLAIPAGLAGLLLLELVRSARFLPFIEWWLGLRLAWQLALALAALYLLCLICHGELHRVRPAPRRLTAFYLAVSVGGMAGGILAGVVAPLVFPLYQELSVGLLGVAALLVATLWREGRSRPPGTWLRASRGAALIGLAFLVLVTVLPSRSELEGVIHTQRTFYGLHRIQRLDTASPRHDHLVLMHGSTVHGAQYLDPSLRRIPAAYYSPSSGVGLVLETLVATDARRRIMQVGAVGLGAGALAAYLRVGDRIRFYEIDPAVVELATGTFGEGESAVGFTYLADCEGRHEIVLGDARLSLERELARDPAGRRYDLLVIDAFSNAAIPVHLYTVEAMELYLRHLRDGGALAFHCSSQHLDLRPLLYQLADRAGLHSLLLSNIARDYADGFDGQCHASLAADWVIMTRNQELLEALDLIVRPLVESGELRVELGSGQRYAHLPVWTDARSDLLALLKSRVHAR